MLDSLKTTLIAVGVTAATLALSSLTGIGMSTTKIVHTNEQMANVADKASLDAIKANFDAKFTAVEQNLDQVTELAVDITNKGSKDVRQEVAKQAKTIRQIATQKANDTMKKAIEEVEAKRKAETITAREKEKENKTNVFAMRAMRQPTN
jgi:polyhydroxyalkanoate synthesis regulator phasin